MDVLHDLLLLPFFFILDHQLVYNSSELLLYHLFMHMFFEEIIYNLLEESIHASYFFVEVVTALDEIQVEVFEEEHADDMIESDEQVHVNADTTDYNVLDSLV